MKKKQAGEKNHKGKKKKIIKKTSRLFFNEIAHDAIVEIIHRNPLNSFFFVFLLLGFQCTFNEDLLQLFVDVIDAKLFERVVLEDFEAIDIEHTDGHLVVRVVQRMRFGVDRHIDAVHDPIEQVQIEKLFF